MVQYMHVTEEHIAISLASQHSNLKTEGAIPSETLSYTGFYRIPLCYYEGKYRTSANTSQVSLPPLRPL